MNLAAAQMALATEVPASARFLLLVLAVHADSDWQAWPSVEQLSAETGLDRRSVQRLLRVLEDAGTIETTHRARRSSVYVIHRGGTMPPKANGLGRHQARVRAASDAIRGGTVPHRSKQEVAGSARAVPQTDDRGTFLPGSGWIPDTDHATKRAHG